MDDPAGWQEFAHPEFPLRFRYPAVTPEGRVVERRDERRGDIVRVHLTTPDKGELYFEVTRFPCIAPADEYAGHKPHLEKRFGAEAVSPLTETSFHGRPAWTYDFWWPEGERAAFLLPVGGDTYRIIYDPRSSLNTRVIDTVSVID
jgi:hypothetical protein